MGTRIEGKVHLPDGSPVSEARVFFTVAPMSLPDVALLTDDQGRFLLYAPAAGQYELVCHADDALSAQVPIEVQVGEERLEVDIELSPAPDRSDRN